MTGENDSVIRVEERLNGLVTRVDGHGERIANVEARTAEHDRQLVSLARTAEATTRLTAVLEEAQRDIRDLVVGQNEIRSDAQRDRDKRVEREDEDRKNSKTFRLMLWAILVTAGIGLLGLIVTLLVSAPHG